MKTVRSMLALLMILVVVQTSSGQQGLTIVVLRGQDATNDLRIGNTVVPLVEVRDTDGKPVEGADVTFELPGAGPGGSFEGWMRARTVRTNELGQAAATGFAPNAETGRFEIRVSAEATGKTGQTAFTQTNGPETLTTASPRRVASKRKFLIFLLVGTTGFAVAATVRRLHRDTGSANGWWGAAMAVGSVLTTVSLLAKAPKSRTEKVASARGPIEITPVRHAGLMLRGGGTVIYIDPAGEADYPEKPRAGLVLVTNTDNDHFDPSLLNRLLKAGATIYGPEAAARMVPGIGILRSGDARDFGQWKIETVPAYNEPRTDAPGKVFHEKSVGNGYVLALGGKRLYVSGDTGNTAEMRGLREIDVAFLAMNPPYTMTAEEAAAAARGFKPKVVYPYHYRSNLLTIHRFRNAIAETGIDVRIRDWYE